jgi:hypothetical protein
MGAPAPTVHWSIPHHLSCPKIGCDMDATWARWTRDGREMASADCVAGATLWQAHNILPDAG